MKNSIFFAAFKNGIWQTLRVNKHSKIYLACKICIAFQCISSLYFSNCYLWSPAPPTPHCFPSPRKEWTNYRNSNLIIFWFLLPQQNLPSPRHVNLSVAKELTALETHTCWFIDYKLKKDPARLFRYQVRNLPELLKAKIFEYLAPRSMTRTGDFCLLW